MNILLGVTGGIAAFKAAALTSTLVQDGQDVQVVLTRAAENFVGRATFQALTGRHVATDLFDPHYPLGAHIELADWADVFCVAPASADVLAKAAQGLADDLVSTLLLSFTGQVLFAPAMNVEMWQQPAVKRNVALLEQDGRQFVGPAAGWQSCRRTGTGRMAEPEEIRAAINKLSGKDSSGSV